MTSTARARPQVLAALTAIRFPLAVWVLLYHVSKPWLVTHEGPVRNLIAGAPIAVPFFFVLSGFVLTYGASTPLHLGSYLRARALRILPIYWLSVLLVVPIGFAARSRGVVIDDAPLLSLGAVAVGVQAWLPSVALRWNPALWSVSAELFLYACFPLLLPLVLGLERRAAMTATAVCAAGAALPAIAYVVVLPDGPLGNTLDEQGLWLHVVRFNPALRLFELAMGMCAARAFALGARVSSVKAIGVVLALAGLLALGNVPLVFFYGGATAIVSAIAVAALAGVSSGPLVSRVAVRLGETSYALYALHLPVLFWAMAIKKRPPAEFDPVFAVVVMAVAIGVAIGAQRFIEEPARRALRPRQNDEAAPRVS